MQGVYRLDSFGCFFTIDEGTIYTRPMLKDGSIDSLSDWNEVSDPVRGFIEAVSETISTGLVND